MAANVAIYAGRVSDAKKGTETYFLRAVSLVDGKKLSEIPLDCPPTYDGLALAGEKVFVSLQNGMLMCFGK